MFPKNCIEKFQITKAEQLIEKKYNAEDEYNIYLVINRTLAEEIWNKKLIGELQPYKSLTDCFQSNAIYNIII